MSQQIELACRYADHGRFDSAVRVCRAIDPSRTEYATAQSLIGSTYRQVGRHDLARRFDDRGASTTDDALGRTMCLLGQVADCVGGGDTGGAAESLRSADAALAGLGPWHWATRWFDPWLTRAWVGAELELLRSRPAAAVEVLEPFSAVKPRATRNTRWHHDRAKTLLFLGVAQRDCGQAGAAADNILQAVQISARARLAPLLVASLPLLEELDSAAAGQYRGEGLLAQRLIERHNPPSP